MAKEVHEFSHTQSVTTQSTIVAKQQNEAEQAGVISIIIIMYASQPANQSNQPLALLVLSLVSGLMCCPKKKSSWLTKPEPYVLLLLCMLCILRVKWNKAGRNRLEMNSSFVGRISWNSHCASYNGNHHDMMRRDFKCMNQCIVKL